jgi:GMP synthase (glutamine-hydrolysing)
MGSCEVRFVPNLDLSADRTAADGAPRTGFELAPLFGSAVFPAQLSHVESVLEPPPGARVLARTDLDPYSVLAFGPRQWGVQFHPEFDRPIMQKYLEARRDVLLDEAFDPDAMIGSVVETPVSAGVLARFADLVRGHR